MVPVNTMPPRTSQVHGRAGASKIDPNPSSFNLREFVVDEDAANFNSTLWKSIDQQSFVTAQRDALEAYNIEKALRLSKTTAAEESQRRTAAAAAIDATISISSTNASGTARIAIAPVSEPQASSTTATGRSSVAQSQPIAIKKAPASHPPTSDEAAAFSLARSWQVDALQVPLLENKQPAATTTTTTTSSSANMSAKPKSSSTSHSSSSLSSHDKKASAPVSVSPKQRSQNISLSTSSFVDTASVPSHSRVSSHSNTILSSPQSHRIEQRSLSKRDPEPSSNSSRPAVNSDVTNTTPKRPRTERQLSSSPPHSRSTSNHAPVAAPSSPDSKKSTASSKDIRPGLILNPSKENSPPPTPVDPSHASRSRPADQASESSSDHQFFTATRSCIKCGNLVLSPRSEVCILLPLSVFTFRHINFFFCFLVSLRWNTTHSRFPSPISSISPAQVAGPAIVEAVLPLPGAARAAPAAQHAQSGTAAPKCARSPYSKRSAASTASSPRKRASQRQCTRGPSLTGKRTSSSSYPRRSRCAGSRTRWFARCGYCVFGCRRLRVRPRRDRTTMTKRVRGWSCIPPLPAFSRRRTSPR